MKNEGKQNQKHNSKKKSISKRKVYIKKIRKKITFVTACLQLRNLKKSFLAMRKYHESFKCILV